MFVLPLICQVFPGITGHLSDIKVYLDVVPAMFIIVGRGWGVGNGPFLSAVPPPFLAAPFEK